MLERDWSRSEAKQERDRYFAQRNHILGRRAIQYSTFHVMKDLIRKPFYSGTSTRFVERMSRLLEAQVQQGVSNKSLIPCLRWVLRKCQDQPPESASKLVISAQLLSICEAQGHLDDLRTQIEDAERVFYKSHATYHWSYNSDYYRQVSDHFLRAELSLAATIFDCGYGDTGVQMFVAILHKASCLFGNDSRKVLDLAVDVALQVFAIYDRGHADWHGRNWIMLALYFAKGRSPCREVVEKALEAESFKPLIEMYGKRHSHGWLRRVVDSDQPNEGGT